MDRISTSDLEPCSVNQLTAYLCTLKAAKKGLPYGEPVCVCASPLITTTDALLQLASAIGPHIGLLEVYADIIDDWSEETARQLTLLAKRHAFLIWEGGRILNSTVDFLGKQSSDVREVRNELVSLIRKRYTRGVIKPASWAGLATAWASGVAVDNQEADILIPALKAAARETVAGTAQTIRTVITAENNSDRHVENEEDDSSHFADQLLTSEHVASDNSLGLPPRKASTISLTQTISQHTEESTDFDPEDLKSERRDSLDQTITNDNLPSPPLFARGIVLCLPSVNSASFTLEYRQSCIAAARANPDFVVGFLCSEPWQIVSQTDDILEDGQSSQNDMEEKKGQDINSDNERRHCLAIFSVIPHRLKRLEVFGKGNTSDNEDDLTGSSVTPTGAECTLNPIALKLHTIVEHALKLREAASTNGEGIRSKKKTSRGPSILHIPVISLP